MRLKNAIFVSESLEDTCLEKSGSNTHFGEDGVKELVIICDHIHFSQRNEWTQDCFLSPKGAVPWRNPCDTDTGNELSAGGLAFLLAISDAT